MIDWRDALRGGKQQDEPDALDILLGLALLFVLLPWLLGKRS